MISKKLGNPFQNLPAPRIPRSVHNLSHSVTTTMNVGTLYPIDWQEVLPSDTFNCKATNVSRLTSAFIRPVMDNLYLDTYHFYIPYDQIYDGAQGIFGEANPSQYVERELNSMPSISNGTCSSGSVADYLGIPPGSFTGSISLAPFRAFAHIYNEWFRNENVVDEVYLNHGEASQSEVLNNLPWSPSNYTGRLPRVSKYKDYFTSALPSPQKGPSVPLPLFSNNELNEQSLPVVTGPVHTSTINGKLGMQVATVGNPAQSGFLYNNLGIITAPLETVGTVYRYEGTSSNSGGAVVPANLWASFDGVSTNLNDLRFSEAYQHDLELDALYGTRYNEWLLSHFGVRSDDLEIGIPKYLGGSRTPLNVTQVTNNTSGTETSPLGDVGAYSWSVGNSVYRYRFKYHGIVMTVAALRYKHTYQQGIPVKFRKLTSADIYNPSFAYIGMQPIQTTELYASADPDTVFGYKPAWNEYRQAFNTISGEARSSAPNSLDIWHFADNYSSSPVLSQAFLEENKEFFERTIALDSGDDSTDGQDNFILNFWFDLYAKRPITDFAMPSINVRMW